MNRKTALTILAVTVILLTTALLPLGCAKAAPPQLVAVVPADGSRDVTRGTLITLRFDQPMAPAAAGFASLEPQPPGGWFVTGETVVFDPVVPLEAGTTYTLTLRAGAPSARGAASGAAGTWSFTVAPAFCAHLPTLVPLAPCEVAQGVRALAFGPQGELYAATDKDVFVLEQAKDGLRGSGDSAGDTAGGGAWSGPALYSAGWTAIEDIDVDAGGRVWLLLAEESNYRAVRLAAEKTGEGPGERTADLTVAIPQPTYPEGEPNVFYPKCLASLPGGDLLVLGTDRLLRLGQDGQVKAELGAGPLWGEMKGAYAGPAGMVVDGGTVYVENGKGSAHTRGVVAIPLDNPGAGAGFEAYPFGVGRFDGLARDQWGNFYTVGRLPNAGTQLLAFGPKGDPLAGLEGVVGLPVTLEAPSEAPTVGGFVPGKLLIRDGVLYLTDPVGGVIRRYSIQ